MLQEQKFSMLKPSKSKSGRRLYRERDLDLILKIKKLKDARYNDEKINELLKNHVQDTVLNDKNEVPSKKERQDLLAEINHDLNEILKLLDDQ